MTHAAYKDKELCHRERLNLPRNCARAGQDDRNEHFQQALSAAVNNTRFFLQGTVSDTLNDVPL